MILLVIGKQFITTPPDTVSIVAVAAAWLGTADAVNNMLESIVLT